MALYTLFHQTLPYISCFIDLSFSYCLIQHSSGDGPEAFVGQDALRCGWHWGWDPGGEVDSTGVCPKIWDLHDKPETAFYYRDNVGSLDWAWGIRISSRSLSMWGFGPQFGSSLTGEVRFYWASIFHRHMEGVIQPTCPFKWPMCQCSPPWTPNPNKWMKYDKYMGTGQFLGALAQTLSWHKPLMEPGWWWLFEEFISMEARFEGRLAWLGAQFSWRRWLW